MLILIIASSPLMVFAVGLISGNKIVLYIMWALNGLKYIVLLPYQLRNPKIIFRASKHNSMCFVLKMVAHIVNVYTIIISSNKYISRWQLSLFTTTHMPFYAILNVQQHGLAATISKCIKFNVTSRTAYSTAELLVYSPTTYEVTKCCWKDLVWLSSSFSSPSFSDSGCVSCLEIQSLLLLKF